MFTAICKSRIYIVGLGISLLGDKKYKPRNEDRDLELFFDLFHDTIELSEIFLGEKSELGEDVCSARRIEL